MNHIDGMHTLNEFFLVLRAGREGGFEEEFEELPTSLYSCMIQLVLTPFGGLPP